MEEASEETETAKTPTPVASPARVNNQERIHQEASPGEGSGTKATDGAAAGTSARPEAEAMTRKPSAGANSPPLVQASYPLATSGLPNLESLDMAGLRNEYINRLTQHMKLEGELVKTMLKRHEVNILFPFYLYLSEHILPYVL